jgi:tetratricopeptide (TPR) repeat protein
MIWLLAIQLAIGPTEHYEQAKQDFAQRKFSEAGAEVNAALHENPSMVPALVLKARLATLAHRPDIAKSCLITAITVDPTSEEAQFYLGVLLYEQNDFKPAISPLEAAQRLAPNSPLPVFYLAMTHEALRDPNKALELYQQAENLSPQTSPQSAEIAVAYGRLLGFLGRTQEGMEKERRAIVIDPKSRDAHYLLAKGLEYEGNFENAAMEGELALTLPEASVRDDEIHFLLARVYRKLNKPDLAETHMEKFQALKKAAQQ